MGLNIHVYQMPDRSRPDWWDSSRYAGDTEFWDSEEIEWRYNRSVDGEIYKRPEVIYRAILWVAEHVREENKGRLIEMLMRLQGDPALWLYGSR